LRAWCFELLTKQTENDREGAISRFWSRIRPQIRPQLGSGGRMALDKQLI
jgi:hypothetical protein